MNKILSQEEIDEILKQQLYQSDTDLLVKEQIEKEEMLESLLDYKYNENTSMIEKMFSVNEVKHDISNDLVNYQNSPYYQTYLYIYNNVENILVPVIRQIEDEYRYMESKNFISNAAFDKLRKDLLFPNFILAQVVYDDLLNRINDVLNTYKTIDDIKLYANIERVKYLATDKNVKIAKPVDGYKLIINVKRQEKIK